VRVLTWHSKLEGSEMGELGVIEGEIRLKWLGHLVNWFEMKKVIEINVFDPID